MERNAKMKKYTFTEVLDDKQLDEINGGYQWENDEILEYIHARDESGYNEIMAGKNDNSIGMRMIRYLYHHNIPLVAMVLAGKKTNTYFFGDKDHMDKAYEVSYEQLMESVKKNLG